MMKNAFYIMLKAPFALKIFKSWLFGHAGKRLQKKAKVNFLIFQAVKGIGQLNLVSL